MSRILHGFMTTVLLTGLPAPQASADHASVIVFDASGSMWAQLENGKSRIEIAREVMGDFAGERDASTSVGVVAYGHSRRGDCEDIEVVLPVGEHGGTGLEQTIRRLNPRGKTPLTAAMSRARTMLPPTAESADIILITDGLENCGGDPCALAAEFAVEGIDLRAHVVGFALEAEAVQTLACVPEQTGGQLFTTQSGAELAAALTEVVDVAPALQSVTLTAVDARDGARLGTAAWDVRAAEGAKVFDRRDGGRISVDLMPGDYVAEARAPGFAGRAEFVVPEGDATPVVVDLEKTSATLFLRAENAATGEALRGVAWRALNVENERTVEAVNEDGGYLPVLLPPGDYRIEGALGEMTGAVSVTATLAEDPRLDVALAAPMVEVEFTAPSEATAGTAFDIGVSGADSERDYMILAPADSPVETSRYQRMDNRVGGDGTYEYTAPSDPGDYELRYYLARDNSIAARAALTVLPADPVMIAPAEVRTEVAFEVEIAGGISGHVVIVEAGRAPDEIVSRYQRMKNSVSGDEGTITRTAPETPGRYLLRYHAEDDRRLLVERSLTVVE